jgi:hypothetical protein
MEKAPTPLKSVDENIKLNHSTDFYRLKLTD